MLVTGSRTSGWRGTSLNRANESLRDLTPHPADDSLAASATHNALRGGRDSFASCSPSLVYASWPRKNDIDSLPYAGRLERPVLSKIRGEVVSQSVPGRVPTVFLDLCWAMIVRVDWRVALVPGLAVLGVGM